jgi:NAD(P)-dependent dehydrogenase (short-subunit alcohol dehydrogenase family)
MTRGALAKSKAPSTETHNAIISKKVIAPLAHKSSAIIGGDSNMKTVIITGGNSGLGYKTALNLSKQGADWNIIIACRNEARARTAVANSKMNNISYGIMDLSSLESIRNFANTVNEPVYGLICNAAGQAEAPTAEGFESIFGACHLGHFLLTNLLLPKQLKKVIFVASDMHSPPKMIGKVEYNGAAELAYPTEDKGMLKYAVSKLCNIMTAYELAERYPDVLANAFNPGFMNDTGLAGRHNVLRWFVKNIFGPFVARTQGRLGNSDRSSRALAEIMISGDYTGKYNDRGVIKSSSELSYNKENQRELWKTSEKLVGLI